MKIAGWLIVALSPSLAIAAGKPLVSVPHFDGKFMWVKLGDLPSATAKGMAGAKSVLIDVTFPKPVTLKKDSGGNSWFTFILADQGSDWKWHQTTVGAGVPTAGNTIKAGKYTLSLPLAGIPGLILHDKKQTVSLGPATSGQVGVCAFSIDAIRTK